MSYCRMPAEPLIKIGFRYVPEGLTFSNGERANNKLELDFESVKPYNEIFYEAIQLMVANIRPFEPDGITAVPNGATGYITYVAAALSTLEGRYIRSIELHKDQESKAIDYKDAAQRAAAADCQRIGVLEDLLDGCSGRL